MPLFRIKEFEWTEQQDSYYVYQGKDEIEVKLNSGFTAARDILEFVHHFATSDKPINLYVYYHNEQLKYFLQGEEDKIKEDLEKWIPKCVWVKEVSNLETSFATEKVTLRGCASPLIMKEREENLIDELIRALPRETFLIQLKLGVKNTEEVNEQLKKLEDTIDELSQRSAVQIGEQGNIGDKLDKMIFGGGNISYEQKNISMQQQTELLENHLYTLRSQGAVFRSAEFTIYAEKDIASLIASKMETFSRRSGSLTRHRLRRDPASSIEYLNYVNSHNLASIMALPMSVVPGIKHNQRVVFGSETSSDVGRSAHLGNLITVHETSLPVHIPLRDLTKHIFVTGVTGSGKTSTIKSLLMQVYQQKTPFLVIEPAKTEYKYLERQLQTVKRYTLGIEGAHSFKINPFEFPEHIHIQTHLDHLKSVFVAAFPMYGPMPYILETAFYHIYRRTGWDLISGRNIYEGRLKRQDLFPTLQELYFAIDQAIEQAGYSADLTSDIRGALKVRIGSLLSGAKGAMLNTRQGHSISKLLQTPSIIELEYVGDDQEKVFLMGLLLISIYEHYISEGKHSDHLKHLLVIEEAHRLLENVRSSGNQEISDMKGKAVETFNNMLSEIRTYGQGLVVADQIPTKLSPDIIKNTNLKIVHRLFAKDDRQIIGDSIGLEDDEVKELIRLKQGEAIVFHGNLDSALKVKIHADKSILAENQEETMHPVFKVFDPEDYLLQQAEILRFGYQLISTYMLFPELREKIDNNLLIHVNELIGNDLSKEQLSTLWFGLIKNYMNEFNLAQRIPYFRLIELIGNMEKHPDPLKGLKEMLHLYVNVEPHNHPMAKFSKLYEHYYFLRCLLSFKEQQITDFLTQYNQKLSFEDNTLAALILKKSEIGRFIRIQLLNSEQRMLLVRSIMLYEYVDYQQVLDMFFEIKDISK